MVKQPLGLWNLSIGVTFYILVLPPGHMPLGGNLRHILSVHIPHLGLYSPLFSTGEDFSLSTKLWILSNLEWYSLTIFAVHDDVIFIPRIGPGCDYSHFERSQNLVMVDWERILLLSY